LLYKVLFEMKKDMNDMKLLINEIMQHGTDPAWRERHAGLAQTLHTETGTPQFIPTLDPSITIHTPTLTVPAIPVSNVQPHTEVEESLSLEDKEKEFIQKALDKHKGKRKLAARELGISERTLYRKMNEYGIRS